MQCNASKLEDIRQGVESRVAEIAKAYPKFDEKFEESLILLQDVLGIANNESDKLGVVYSKFLLRVGILSYFGKLENDVNLNKLIEIENERLIERAKAGDTVSKENALDLGVTEVTYEEEIKDSEADSSDEERKTKTTVAYVKQSLDFMFGFQGYTDILTAFLESIINSSENKESVQIKLESNLLGSIRDISAEDYIKNDYYINSDIELITILGRKPPVDLKEEIMTLIKSNHTYHGYCTQLLSAILTTYRYTLQDSFGLRPYKGVVIKGNPYVYTISDNFKLISIQNARNAFSPVSEAILEKLNIVVKDDRQFDIRDIIYGEHKLTKYYPKKILEYAMGRELTSNLASGVYKPHAKNKSWEEYEAAYVKSQITEYIYEAIYYSLEKNITFSNSSIKELRTYKKPADFSFNNDAKFNEIFSQNRELIEKELLISPEINKSLKSDLMYFQKCLCTMVCAIKYNAVGDQVNALGIRVVDTAGTLSPTYSKSIFEPLSTNLNTIYHDGLTISDGKTTDGVTPLPYNIYEYSHDFNEALSSAEPLFGYTAVELFIKRGIAIKWDKILLGEDFKGTPFFASLESRDDVQVQGNLVHNMIAGSRAGKGVQTMNLLGSALASGKPIFYLDNKPDMATMFYQLSGGNMFIVQGGFFGANADKSFTDTGAALAGWDTHYDSLPPYVRDSFFRNRTYVGDFGQMVYFRALMLIFGIILARVASEGNNPSVYSSLGGSNGITVVVDEYKAWQTFEEQFFSCQGVFGKKFKDIDTLESKLSDLQDNLDLEQEKLASMEPGKSTYINTEAKIRKIKKNMSSLISPEEAYATQMMYKLGETLTELRASAVAGMKNNERKCSDIFVIAQNIKLPYDIDSVTPTVYTRKADGTFNTTSDGKLNNNSLTRGFFDCIDHDWFIGANLDKDIAGAKTNKKFASLVQGKSYWLYIPAEDNPTSALVDGVCKHETIFKPYLVLNNAKEDDPNHRKKIVGVDEFGKTTDVPDPDYNYVGQCRDRVNKAVPNLWESVRLKHLSDACREDAEAGIDMHYGELNAGIGFEGLVNLIKQSNGLGAFDPTTDLSGSLTIANYVANAMGYSDYKDLLFDFSPEGIFSAVDVKNALIAPEIYADTAKRLPVLAKFGFLGGVATQETSMEDPEFSSGSDEDLSEYINTPNEEARQVTQEQPIISDTPITPVSFTTNNDMDSFYRDAEKEMGIDKQVYQEVSSTKPIFTDKDRENYAYPIVTILLDQLSQFTGKNLKPLAPQMIENAKALLKNLGY